MGTSDTSDERIRENGRRAEFLDGRSERPRTETPNEQPIRCDSLRAVDITKIPPRQWAYGSFLMFRQAAALGGVDGSGKGSMAVTIALAMITGRALLGEKVWKAGPVAIITYEDDVEEWHRRFAAACIHHAIDYETTISKIHFLSAGRRKICFAEMGDHATVFPDGNAVIDILARLNVALLIIDPWNHAHGFADGNSNALMAQAAGEVNRVASETGAAILVLHHLRKGSTGVIDDLMGATSLRATFRSTRILQRMTTEEATALGITDDPWRYSRISGSKANYAPPVDQAMWFQLVNGELNNGDEAYPQGDACGVTASWQSPKAFDNLDATTLREIFDQIRQGPGDGQPYRQHRQAGESWVGNVIVKHARKSPEQAGTIVKQWLANGVLITETYRHPITRRDAVRVSLNAAAVAAILQSLQGQYSGR